MDLNTVSRFYNNQSQLELATDNLLASGFRSESLSVILPNGKTKAINAINQSNPLKHLTFSDDVAIGIETGALIGSAAGLLAGLGLLGISSVDGVMLGKPIALVISGLIVGALIGSLGGALLGWSLSIKKAEDYKLKDLTTKGLMLVVHTTSEKEEQQAEEVLRKTDESFLRLRTNDYKNRADFYPSKTVTQ